MRLLVLDYAFGFEPADYAAFSSDTSCYDFDAVLWDPGRSLDDYTWYQQHRGLPSLTESSSVQLVADIQRRRTEFTELLGAGKALVVIVRPPQRCYYDTGRRSYSGTGRNRHTTIHINETDVWNALPIAATLTKASGKNLELVGGDRFATFWNENKVHLTYEAVVNTEVGSSIFQIAGTKRAAGTLVTYKSGGVLLLLPAPSFPPPKPRKGNGEDEDALESDERAAAAFQEGLLDLLSELTGGADTKLPAWASDYLVVGEPALRQKAVDQEKRVENARLRLTDTQRLLRQREKRKRLFTASGTPLELEVREVFEALGCTVDDPEPSRDDWIVHFPERTVVVEVKGVSGSAAEKHAAQLEKWVANYLEQHGETPKAVLVVNGFCKKPPAERTKPVFPTQMLSYSEARAHCLITGLQMLGILEDVEAYPENAERWRKKLLSTFGVLQDLQDWKPLMPEVSTEEVASESDEGP